MKASLDRFEGDVAVLIAEGEELRRPRSSLSHAAREGDVIDLDTGEVDRAETDRLRRSVEAQLAKAKKLKPGGLDL